MAVMVVEAIGKWHRFVRRSLFAAGLPVPLVDPNRVHAFARVQGLFRQDQSARPPGAGAVRTGDERRG